MSDVNRKPLMDAAESETLSMRGNSMRENRETLEPPTRGTAHRVVGCGGRSGKADAVARHERLQGVARSHSTDEAGEQDRPDGGGGVCGGKGIGQGEPTGKPYSLRTQRRGKRGIGLLAVRTALKDDRETRGKSRMR
jgi:hypothetical protein